jgi:hypothetical protein
MTRTLFVAFLFALLAGCAQLPPPPEDAAAKRFEPIRDKAVIYLARHALEPTYVAPVALNDDMIGSTYRGTYMRLELPPGKYRLHGMGGDSGSIALTTEAGKIYFVQHSAHGYRNFVSATFDQVSADYGRSMVMGGQITALITR